MPAGTDRSFLVFRFGETLAALPLEAVERIAPMAELARPPGLPAPLQGILNWGGETVPVLRLERLFQLPESPPSLYSMLVLPKGEASKRVAILVDRVSEIVQVAADDILPARGEDSFNACVEATIQTSGRVIHLLSLTRILLAREHQSLSAYMEMERARLSDWRIAVR